MWRYGRIFPRKISVKNAKEVLWARISESRRRGADTLKRCRGCCRKAGTNWLVFIVYYIVYDVHRILYRIRHCILYYSAYLIRYRHSMNLRHSIQYAVVYDIVCFRPSHLRPLKWLARVFHDELCISHCIFIDLHKII